MTQILAQKLIRVALVTQMLGMFALFLVACGSVKQIESVQQDVNIVSPTISLQTRQAEPAEMASQESPRGSDPSEQIQHEENAGSEGGFVEQWVVDTGDIDQIVVSPDGQVYGLIHQEEPQRHVVISSTGEIEKVSELPVDDRFRWVNLGIEARSDGTFLFSGVYDPDDNPLTSDKNQLIGEITPSGELRLWDMAAFPGDCTYLSRLSYYGSNSILGSTNQGGGPICYYHLDDDSGLVMDSVITVPQDHHLHNLGQLGNAHHVISYEDHDSGEIVHVNPDGDVVYRGTPQGLDLERSIDSYETPWGDLWLRYHEYDAIGADLGERIVRISAEGEENYFDSFIPDDYPQAISHVPRLFYLRDTGEIYYRAKDALLKLDRDYQVLEVLPLSQELTDALTPWSFVGFDGNIYTWEPHSSKKLRKFVWVP